MDGQMLRFKRIMDRNEMEFIVSSKGYNLGFYSPGQRRWIDYKIIDGYLYDLDWTKPHAVCIRVSTTKLVNNSIIMDNLLYYNDELYPLPYKGVSNHLNLRDLVEISKIIKKNFKDKSSYGWVSYLESTYRYEVKLEEKDIYSFELANIIFNKHITDSVNWKKLSDTKSFGFYKESLYYLEEGELFYIPVLDEFSYGVTYFHDEAKLFFVALKYRIVTEIVNHNTEGHNG